MKRTRLNHKKVNALLSEREVEFNLPGGVKSTPVRMSSDGQLGLSDFNRFYVTEAVKAYLGLSNEFDPHKTISKQKLQEKVIDTLKHYDLLIENDHFYDLFLKSVEVKNNILTLEDGDTLESTEWDSALKNAEDAYVSLQNIIEHDKERTISAPMSIVVERIKKDLEQVAKNNRMSLEELLKECIA